VCGAGMFVCADRAVDVHVRVLVVSGGMFVWPRAIGGPMTHQ
jgi:hypothetical protein